MKRSTFLKSLAAFAAAPSVAGTSGGIDAAVPVAAIPAASRGSYFWVGEQAYRYVIVDCDADWTHPHNCIIPI